MRLVSLELSTRMGSVSLIENNKIINEHTWEEKFKNRQQLFDALADINVDWKTIDTFVVGRGPGSFSGLRVGFSVVNTLAAPHKANVIAHNSCVGFGKRFHNKEVVVVGDARRNQLWIGSLMDGKILNQFKLIDYEELSSNIHVGAILISPDHDRLAELINPFQKKEFQKPFYPLASEIGLVVIDNIQKDIKEEEFEPLYMHPPVFIEPKYS